MNLKIQVYSIISSFLFGTLFSLTFNYCYKKMKIRNRYIRLLFNLIFVLVHTIVYYLLMEKVNNGILHPYCLLTVLIGFVIMELLLYYIDKKKHI